MAIAPSEVAGGRRVLRMLVLVLWAAGATLANICASCLRAAIFSPSGGANGAVGAGFVRAWMRSVAAMVAASDEVTLGIVLSWGGTPPCVQCVPLVFSGCRPESNGSG